MQWHPLKMTFHVRTYAFGERLIPQMLGKQGVPAGVVAETWEISDYRETTATIVEGPFAGRTLHDVTLAAALGEGSPIALLVATPAFCATAVCGPVLDVLLAVQGQVPDVRYLHAEVYENPLAVDNVAEATPTALTQDLGLTYEPSLFLIGADGVLVDRLDNVYDETEALESVQALAAG